MVDINKAIIARLKTHGKIFEILVDCDKALEFKAGKSIPLDEILATNDIYKDVKKGEHASENELKEIFKTDDNLKISEEIIRKGEVQQTADHKSKLREEKKKKIINLIHINAIDPKTGLPHPPQRIEAAIEESKVKIQESKSAEEQIEEIMDKLKPIIPIKFETRKIEITIPASFAGKSYNLLKSHGKISNEQWLGDGSLLVMIEIPAGLQEEFFSKLNNLTHGDVSTKIIE